MSAVGHFTVSQDQDGTVTTKSDEVTVKTTTDGHKTTIDHRTGVVESRRR